MGRSAPVLVHQALPAAKKSAEELLDERDEKFERLKAFEEAARLRTVLVKIEGPYAILHFGDPHVDDDGTDTPALRRHVALVRKHKAVFAGTVGDVRNNWKQKLARLWKDQSTSADEAKTLLTWFIRSIEHKLAYLVEGNHDLWSEEDDPIQWILKQEKFAPADMRLEFKPPKGEAHTIWVRHKFAGTAQWNLTHGAIKAAKLIHADDVLINGHTHDCDLHEIVTQDHTRPREHKLKVSHCIQVASYKKYDNYAKVNGLPDSNISPCILTVHDPEQTHPGDKVKHFWEPENGIDYLNHLIRKRRSG